MDGSRLGGAPAIIFGDVAAEDRTELLLGRARDPLHYGHVGFLVDVGRLSEGKEMGGGQQRER